MNARTRSIAIAAPPALVHAYVADAAHLPQWAPAFATSVRRADDHWVVTQGGREFGIALISDARAGTADIVSPLDRTRGAFTRVIPNRDGCAYSFTLLFAPDADADAVEEQLATVDAELAAVRAACEPR